MATLETDWYPEVIPGFDAIECKRRIQAEILRENEGMTREQIRERQRQASERMRKEREQYWAALAESANK